MKLATDTRVISEDNDSGWSNVHKHSDESMFLVHGTK